MRLNGTPLTQIDHAFLHQQARGMCVCLGFARGCLCAGLCVGVRCGAAQRRAAGARSTTPPWVDTSRRGWPGALPARRRLAGGNATQTSSPPCPHNQSNPKPYTTPTQIALVRQEPVLFAESIFDNIAFGCATPPTMAQARRAPAPWHIRRARPIRPCPPPPGVLAPCDLRPRRQVVEAARVANCHEFVSSFPQVGGGGC